MRSIGSAHTDPFSSLPVRLPRSTVRYMAAPINGAAHAERDCSIDKVPEYIKRVKAGEFRLRASPPRYKNYDPRARIIKQVADEVF